MMHILLAKIIFLTFSAQAVDKAGVAFAHALELMDSSRYDEALVELEGIEREFPYSSFAKKAKLKIADIHFDTLNYVQAKYQYKFYHDLYPKEKDSDYALFKSGLSVYKQIPTRSGRDLSQVSEALKIWRKLLISHPKTSYAPEVLKYQSKLIDRLAEKELYIAKFYFKKEKCISAQRRMNKLFAEHPNYLTKTRALKIAHACAKKLGDEPAEKKYLELLEKYDESKS